MMHPVTVPARLAERARLHPHRVMYRVGEQTRTYGEMGRRAEEIAAGLTEAGLGQGDRLAILAEHTLEAWELVFGCARAGVVPVLLNFRLIPAELGQIVADGRCRLLLSTALLGQLGAAVPLEPQTERRDLAEFVTGCVGGTPPDVEIGEHDDLVQLYTSGTTGLPKGVRTTHGNLWHLSEAASHELPAFASDSVHLVAAPLFHSAGFSYGFAGLASGAQSVLVPMFDPVQVAQLIATHRCTNGLLVPAMLQAVIEHPGNADADFSSLRGVLYGGSPMPASLLRAVATRLGCRLTQAYGLTETSGFATLLRWDDHEAALAAEPGSPAAQRIASAGYAVPGIEVGVVDDDRNPVDTGSPGEVVVRGPLVMPGYWQRPEENERLIDPDGWFHTGDVGYLDEDGYLFLVDRKNDLVVTKGENVFPGEVERVLADHEAVREVAVIGVPDESFGERLHAVIVLREGTELGLAELQEYCRGQLAGFKIPRGVDAVEGPLPRTPSGKVLRRALRAPYWAGHERQIH
ncbi:MAG: AMP-binding protein [Geodermatophilaceae bacterium]|nr:AMP-binding protein [Geodermatophilaceae bacterium]